jgi:hypothetical protein
MKLITELLEESVELVTEAKSGQRFIEGVFMQSTVKNRNGRVYPKDILGKEVARYVREEVAQSRAIGELNHPANPVINPERASHLITSLKESGNDYIGKAKILDTPMGNIVSGLLDGGVRLGVSSRGLGSLTKKNGASVVGEDFRLCTVDIVADPSAPSAFVEGIMENAEWVLDEDQNFVLMSDALKETIKKTSSSKLEETKLALFQSFINKL